MKIKNWFIPSVASCLAILSMNGYASWYAKEKVAKVAMGDCSTSDLSVFQEEDEEQMYNGSGFSRGDIRNLFTYKYDPKSEMSVSGNVTKVARVQFPDNNCYLIAVVKTDSGDYLVNLGPVWFADENNVMIMEGDTLQIKGSKMRSNGRFVILGQEVKKNGQTLVLRNMSGNPQWGTAKAQKGTSS